MQTTAINGGVYVIYRPTNRKDFHQVYVGSTDNFEKRFADHKRELRAGDHDCAELQGTWNWCGDSGFRFERLVTIPDNLILPTHPTMKLTQKRFREAVEQLYMAYFFNSPKHMHRNTNLSFVEGDTALRFAEKVLGNPDNRNLFAADDLANLQGLLIEVRTGLRNGSYKHMGKGDGKYIHNNSQYRTKSKSSLPRDKYCVSALKALYHSRYFGKWFTKDQHKQMGELTHYFNLGKLHDC
jgi:hypothetical protein